MEKKSNSHIKLAQVVSVHRAHNDKVESRRRLQDQSGEHSFEDLRGQLRQWTEDQKKRNEAKSG